MIYKDTHPLELAFLQIMLKDYEKEPGWTYDPILGFKGIGSETGVNCWRLVE